MNIVFHPRVFSELDLIMRYYEEVAGLKLAGEFYEEFRKCVRLTANSPQLFSEKNRNFRRVNLNRFPYNFLFRIQTDTIRILVVRHNARKPGFGTFRK